MRFTPLFDEHGRPCSENLISVQDQVNHDNEAAASAFTSFANNDAGDDEEAVLSRQLDLLARQVARLRLQGGRQESGDNAAAEPVSGSDDATIAGDSDPSDDDAFTSSDDDDGAESDHGVAFGSTSPGPLQSSALPPGADEVGAGKHSATVNDGAMIRYRSLGGKDVCVYRAILPGQGVAGDKSTVSVSDEIASLHRFGRWLVMLMHGGHFAGAILHNGKVTHHKCFHRYVIRAKQGGVQSQKDNKSGAKKSAGAQIRRHNEAALKDDISRLLQSWSAEIAKCNLVFLQVPTHSRSDFFAIKGVQLSAKDPRIRSVPFPTRRPTLKEILRIYAKLSAVYEDFSQRSDDCSDDQPSTFDAEVGDKKMNKGKTAPTADHAQSTDADAQAAREENKDDDDDPYQDTALYTAILNGNLDQARELLLSMPESDVNYGWNSGGNTALHAAARHSGEAVKLLLESGADPTKVNERGQVPFTVTGDKETRNAFRRFMAAEPNKWDYAAAKVPSPLTAEMELKQAAKAKADKKRAKDRKKKADRAKAEAARKAAEAAEAASIAAAEEANEKRLRDEQRRRERAMTPRERCAAAALARQQAAAKSAVDPSGSKCDFCGQPMPAKGGFEKFNFVYCQPACMREHKPQM